ncbi:MAG: hypothetical protein IJ808_00090 [Muribaculaceae bacterium]|nr:hypothetical protein [Muribaculaceae bacterium]
MPEERTAPSRRQEVVTLMGAHKPRLRGERERGASSKMPVRSTASRRLQDDYDDVTRAKARWLARRCVQGVTALTATAAQQRPTIHREA